MPANNGFECGVRCGHIDGWARQGAYVAGEEYLVELDDADDEFEAGYIVGYQYGRDAIPLPRQYQYPCEVKPRNWE